MSKASGVYRRVLAAVAATGLCLLSASTSSAAGEAGRLLAQVGTMKGICALVEPQSLELAISLAKQSDLTIYVQLASDEAVQAARKSADHAGLLGTRICVEKGEPSHIGLADNLADAVIAGPQAGTAEEELLRVVHPLGIVLAGSRKVQKPNSAETDDWTHPYYAPDNNPQSHDRLIRAPYLTQFLAEPWYVPFPEVTVTSQGRVFKAFGHVGYKERDWPWLNTLVAINGYNGTLIWKRSLEEGFNIHRNTMIATPEILYLADSKSCKLLDADTGEVRDEILAPQGASGPVWKWMALENGVLYTLVGEEEFRDPTLRGTRTESGWPWAPMTPGYDSREYRWGFGRTFFAYDLAKKKVLWQRDETDQVDGRAVAMKSGRIYYYSPAKSLACLDGGQGEVLWRTTDPDLLAAIGSDNRAQTASIGFSTTHYLKCSDKALYFAGPQRDRLVAVSADDGRLLWQYPHGNFQLVLRQEGLYAMGRTGPSMLFEPMTGKVQADLGVLRGNCTRATGAVDCIFTRGDQHTGTMRLVTAGNRPQRIGLMRPDCHDGVIVSNGLLYWGPWMCDCNLSLVGLISLGPAGDFDFNAEASDSERLETLRDPAKPIKPLAVRPGDWPAYRADNLRSAAVMATVPKAAALAWKHEPAAAITPAAPVTAGGLVFASGSDGVIRAIDAASGKVRWTAYTGGPIAFAPAIADGRLVAGSGDGRVYAFEAATGEPLWRFRAAPADRMIPVYGSLASTWPVASGVLVADGVVYAAAGIASYDGTHVYALDAATGKIRWQNNNSSRLGGEDSVTGVSVQGHLLLHDGTLYMAGGNVVSPAMYNARDGRCLNALPNEWVKTARGRDLFLIDGKVTAFERLLYSPKRYWVGRYFAKYFVQAQSSDVLVRGTLGRLARVAPNTALGQEPKALWETTLFEEPAAVAMGKNALVVAGRLAEPKEGQRFAVTALAVTNGRPLWQHPLPEMPAPWGTALDGDGRVVVALENGDVFCFAQE